MEELAVYDSDVYSQQVESSRRLSIRPERRCFVDADGQAALPK